jgi:predicted  nucleic acid-binding Zn-ribbon protein
VTIFRVGLAWFAFCLLLFPALGQRQREPLTDAEIDQLRDTAMEPDLRLKLYVAFARARLATLEKARSDPKTTDRALATHDGLQNFLDVYDELNENVDTYVDRKADLRKVLKAVIEGDTEFQAKLRALRDDATAKKEEMTQYEFLLSNALDTLDSSVQDHRQLLTEQEEAAKHKKPAPKP